MTSVTDPRSSGICEKADMCATMHNHGGEAAFVGVGGCGMNMLEAWLKHLPPSVCAVGIHRDAARLSKAANRISKVLLGEETKLPPVTREEVQASIRSRLDELTGMLRDASSVYVLAGLGGATGTWASQGVCRHLRSIGKQVVAVLVMPFSFEGKHRQVAETALAAFDGLVRRDIYYNDHLIHHTPEGTSMSDALAMMNELAFESVAQADSAP